MVNRLFISLLFFLITSNVFCQKISFDEIEKNINYNDSLCRSHGDYEQLIKLNLATYQLSKKNGFKKGEVLSLIKVSSGLWNKGDNKNCIQILNRLEKDPYLKIDTSLHIMVLQELAQCYANLKLYKVALDYHYKVKNIVKTNPQLKLEQRNSILNYSYGSIAFIHEQNKAIDSSFYYNHKALKIKESLLILCNTANLHAKNNNIDSLKFYLEEAKLKLETGKHPLLHEMLFKRVYGIYLLKIKNINDAEKYLQESLAMAKKLKRHSAIFFSYSELINFYNEVEDYSKSSNYQKEFNRFVDSTETLRSGYTNFAVEELLKKKDEQIKKENEKSNNFLYILLISFCFLLLFVYFYVKNRKNLLEKLNDLHSIELENLKLKESHEQSYIELVEAIKKNDGSFIILFEKKYESFYKSLISRHPNLTKTELTLCALIRLNLTSKEIAEYTYVQHKTVQTQKNRLRKKLGIFSDVNLYNYFSNEF